MNKTALAFVAALVNDADKRLAVEKLGQAIIDTATEVTVLEDTAFILEVIVGDNLDDQAELAEIVIANC